MGGSKSKPVRSESQVQSMSKVDLAQDMNMDGTTPRARSVTLSKEVLDGGLDGGPCPLNEAQGDNFTISNGTAKKIKWKVDPIPEERCKMVFKPSSGNLGPGASVSVAVQLTLLEQASLNFRVNLRLNGGKETMFINVRCHADQGIFGVDPAELDTVEDHGFEVPQVLAQMRTYLLENKAFVQEGIFRLAGDAGEMKIIKSRINLEKSFVPADSPDVNSVANLLKVFFRDLPQPILNVLPSEVIFKSGDQELCVNAYNNLPEPNKSLMGWLLDLLAEVTAHHEVNKMTPQNLSIVVAPNLYEPPGADPMEGLVMSQKAVQFLHTVLLAQKGG